MHCFCKVTSFRDLGVFQITYTLDGLGSFRGVPLGLHDFVRFSGSSE